MYEEYLEYVKEQLLLNDGNNAPDCKMKFRTKYDHIKRVLGWAKKLAEDRDDVDKEVLFTAAIFHDVGYAKVMDKAHAKLSAKIFEEYAKSNDMDKHLYEKVKKLILLHSNKELLKESDTQLELIILMEADILDEEGAQRMIWYAIDKAFNGPSKYEEIHDHIKMGNDKRLVNPMVTKKAKELWDKKNELVMEFTKQLKEDVNIGN